MSNMRGRERKKGGRAIDYYALSSHGSGLYFPVKAERGTAGRLLLLLLCSSSSSFSSFESRGGGKALKWEVVGERLVPESRTELVSLSLSLSRSWAITGGGRGSPLWLRRRRWEQGKWELVAGGGVGGGRGARQERKWERRSRREGEEGGQERKKRRRSCCSLHKDTKKGCDWRNKKGRSS